MKAIILAAGIGSRLGKPHPKPLTKLSTGETIIGRQIKFLSNYIGEDNIYIVVGFKKELIMEAFPKQIFIYNNLFDQTNTSKSLLCALNKIKDEDVIWLNGDVVFEKEVLEPIINYKGSCMAVNTNSVSDEEVKYNITSLGTINEVSKIIKNGLGEAVGINKITKKSLALFIDSLNKCNNNDYFEKAIENSIKKGLKIYPIDISKRFCIEIDFNEDLVDVNNSLK